MGVAGRGTEQVDLSLIVRLHHERLAEKVIEDGVVHEDDLWDASNRPEGVGPVQQRRREAERTQ